MPGLTAKPLFLHGEGHKVGEGWGHEKEASTGVHRPCGFLALKVPRGSAALEGTGSFPPLWVLWAFTWSVSSRGLHKARLNSQYNSDK